MAFVYESGLNVSEAGLNVSEAGLNVSEAGLNVFESKQFTCNKCRVSFSSRTLANAHYAERWHEYNLIRTLENLPPVSKESFNEILNRSAVLEQGESNIDAIFCDVCKKSFLTQRSFDTHQRSRKHKDNIIRKATECRRNEKTTKGKREVEKSQLNKVLEDEKDSEDEYEGPAFVTDDVANQSSEYCRACKTSFQSLRALESHQKTTNHVKAVMLLKIAEKHQRELDEQDKVMADAVFGMQVDDGDSDWEDMVDVENNTNEDNKIIPVNYCLFCGKRSADVTDSLNHMERRHNFNIPHKYATYNIEELIEYLGEKVGLERRCIECSKQFNTLKACRLHMRDKPHMEIRFEGEYDQFYDINKLLTDVILPAKPEDRDMFALTLPNGTCLTHRDLRKYIKQNLPLTPTPSGVKRLRGPEAPKALGYLSRVTPGSSVVATTREQQRQIRDLKFARKLEQKRYRDLMKQADKGSLWRMYSRAQNLGGG